jgi:hypothetical protein
VGRVEARWGTVVGSAWEGGTEPSVLLPSGEGFCQGALPHSRMARDQRARALHISIASADANCPEPVQDWDAHIVRIRLDGHCCHARLPHAECLVGRLGGHEVGGPVVGHEQELRKRHSVGAAGAVTRVLASWFA